MKILPIIGVLLGAASCVHAADTNPPKFFKLDFTEKELDGTKTISSHTYSVRVSTAPPGTASIRTGSKVPAISNPSGEFTYIEIGVNFDIRQFQEVGGEVSLGLVADISSIAEDAAEKTKVPLIRQNKWNSTVSAKVGKPTVVFSSDDVSSKRQMLVELTATPIH